jgi:hypothetical protein
MRCDVTFSTLPVSAVSVTDDLCPEEIVVDADITVFVALEDQTTTEQGIEVADGELTPPGRRSRLGSEILVCDVGEAGLSTVDGGVWIVWLENIESQSGAEHPVPVIEVHPILEDLPFHVPVIRVLHLVGQPKALGEGTRGVIGSFLSEGGR